MRVAAGRSGRAPPAGPRCREARACGSGAAAGGMLFGRQHVARRDHPQRVDPAAIDPHHLEFKAVDAGGLAAARQATQLLHEQTRNGVEALLLGEPRAEVFVELIDAGHAAHRELTLAVATDVLNVLDVELVVDLADDLFDDVLDGDQPGDAAVLIDDDRHVIAVAAELLQQHVQALGLRHELRRPHVLADVEARRGADGESQQVLGHQNPDDIVAVLVHDRVARVAGFDHHREDLRRWRRAPHDHHLPAWHHDVAYMQTRNPEHPFEHGERITVQDAALAGFTQHTEQLLAILGLDRESLGKTFQPAPGAVQILRHAYGLRYGLAKPRRLSTATSRRSMRCASASRSWS